jgi:anti-sigma-K factor RskA
MPLADGTRPDDLALRRYLTGLLPAEQADHFDELSVTDAEFAALVRAAEHDLIDAYVNGELSGEVLDRFRSHYLSSPAGRERVTFAETFASHQAATRDATRPGPAPGGFAYWPQWGLAAAALLVMSAAGYLFVQNARLQDRLDDTIAVRARLEEREKQLQTELEAERSATAKTLEELVRLRESLERPESVNPDTPGSVGLGILAFTISAATRGTGNLPVLAIPPGATTITLRLLLEADDFPRYDVALQEAGAKKELWRSGRLQAVASGGVKALSVSIPAGLLQPRVYTAELTGVPPTGEPQYVSGYPFRVVRD